RPGYGPVPDSCDAARENFIRSPPRRARASRWMITESRHPAAASKKRFGVLRLAHRFQKIGRQQASGAHRQGPENLAPAQGQGRPDLGSVGQAPGQVTGAPLPKPDYVSWAEHT